MLRIDWSISATEGKFHASNRPLRGDPDALRMVARKALSRRHQGKNDREARAAYCRRREEKSPDSRPPGALLRALLLRRTKQSLARAHGKSSRRPYAPAHAKAREKIRDGAHRPRLR